MPRNTPKAANASVAESRLSNAFAITEGQEADLDAVILSRDSIDPDPDQPRVFFDEAKLRELGEDLRQHALQPLQPLIVRPHPLREGRFMIVAGERRWRAAGWEFGDIERLRCTLRNLNEEQVALIQGAENDKREDTSVIAKGRNYNRVKNASGLTWAEVGLRVGASEQTVLRHVRLLRLPRDVQDFIEKNALSEKHGRAFLWLQESGTGVSGPDLSKEKPNKNHRRLMANITDAIARGKVVSGDQAILLSKDYVDRMPQPHDDARNARYQEEEQKRVEEQAAILREKNRAALESGDVSAQSAPLQLVKDGDPPTTPPAAPAAGLSTALPTDDVSLADKALDNALIVLKDWMRHLSVEHENQVTADYKRALEHIKEARRALKRIVEKHD